MNRLSGFGLVAVMAVLAATASAGEGLTSAHTAKWASTVIGKELTTELFVPAEGAPGASRRGRAGIIYLKNLNAPRIGGESDESIIGDFLREGYLVLTIDYGKDPKAVAPYINPDLRAMRMCLMGARGRPGLFDPQRVQVDQTYILPEGYRLARDILYYGGGNDCYRLDVRYPSKAEKPVPAVMQIPVDNSNRMNNEAHWRWNELISEGLLTRGYAAVQADNPIKHYKGVDYMPDIAYKLKAAVRTIRANAKQYNIDADHIGVMGFSRGSGQAGILAMSGGIKELEKGPHLEYSSRVQAALLHAGRMDHLALLTDCPQMARTYEAAFGDPVKNRKVWADHSAITYVTDDDPPTFLSVGSEDWYRTKQISLMAEALKKTGVECKHVETPGLGHNVTPDVKVQEQIYDFFDKHLKPSHRAGAAKDAGAARPAEKRE